MVSMTLWLLTGLVPLQIFLGDAHGLNTREYQPAKLAAIESRWETGREIPITLFAIPDEKAETNRFSIDVPHLGSLILTHELNGEVKGLKDFPADQRPPVAIPFFAFRIMVGCAVVMLGVVLLGGWLRWRGELALSPPPLFLLLCRLTTPIGFIAVIAGWVVTEVGRQPWVVYGVLRTADATTPFLTTRAATISLVIFCAVYAFIFLFGTFYIYRLIRTGPVGKLFATPRLAVSNRQTSLTNADHIFPEHSHVGAGE